MSECVLKILCLHPNILVSQILETSRYLCNLYTCTICNWRIYKSLINKSMRLLKVSKSWRVKTVETDACDWTTHGGYSRTCWRKFSGSRIVQQRRASCQTHQAGCCDVTLRWFYLRQETLLVWSAVCVWLRCRGRAYQHHLLCLILMTRWCQEPSPAPVLTLLLCCSPESRVLQWEGWQPGEWDSTCGS